MPEFPLAIRVLRQRVIAGLYPGTHNRPGRAHWRPPKVSSLSPLAVLAGSHPWIRVYERYLVNKRYSRE